MAKETPELLDNVIEEMDILATQDFLDPRGVYSECIWHPRQIAKWLRELKELRGIKKPHMVNNRPLTPRELMDLDGEIVWVKFNWSDYEDQYMVVDAVNQVCGSLSPGKIFYFKANKEGLCSYWDIWAAYRYKPEDCDDKEVH